MTPITIAELDAIYEKATKGPWLHDRKSPWVYGGPDPQSNHQNGRVCIFNLAAFGDIGNDTTDDIYAAADLCVALVNAWPEIRDILRRMQNP